MPKTIIVKGSRQISNLFRECFTDWNPRSSLISRIKGICNYADARELDLIIPGFRWMRLLSDQQASVQDTLLDTLAKHLERTMRFNPGERVLVMLQYVFIVEWADGRTVRVSLLPSPVPMAASKLSMLELFGDPRGISPALSLSVGLTCGYHDAAYGGRSRYVHRSWGARALHDGHVRSHFREG